MSSFEEICGAGVAKEETIAAISRTYSRKCLTHNQYIHNYCWPTTKHQKNQCTRKRTYFTRHVYYFQNKTLERYGQFTKIYLIELGLAATVKIAQL